MCVCVCVCQQVGEVTTQLETAEAGLESLQSANRTRSTQSALDAAQTKLRETTAQADTAKATHDQVGRHTHAHTYTHMSAHGSTQRELHTHTHTEAEACVLMWLELHSTFVV